MTELVGVYRTILEVSREKKKLLVSASVEELDELTKREDSLILQIGKLETDREQVIAELANIYALARTDLTLSKAKQLASGEVAAKLQALESDLTGITTELVLNNKINTELIQQSLNYVNYSLNLLTQNSTGTNYAAKGIEKSAPRSKALIDAKV
jgi:flagellar biosynthesis/type III secretory pathway chaperone